MLDNRTLCAVCAWRATCKKKFSIGDSLHCPDFTRDVTIKEEKKEEVLYYDAPYKFEFDAKVTDIKRYKDNLFAIKLDKTYFYPESGGQLSDRGTIDGIELVDLIKENDEVIHILKSEPSKDSVNCKIDKEVRIDHTIQHSAQHLLSAILFRDYKVPTKSFHMSDNYSSIDIDIEQFTNDIWYDLEEKIFEEIRNGRKVNTFWIEPSELPNYNVRKIGKYGDKIRIVQIEGIENTMCAGTHVKNLSEIGMFKIINFEKIKKGYTRIYYLAGKRALNYFFNATSYLNKLSTIFSLRDFELEEGAKKVFSEKESLQKELQAIKKELILSKLNNIEISQKFVEKVDGLDRKMMNFYAKELLKKGAKVVFLFNESEKFILLMKNKSSEVVLKELGDKWKEKYNAKGGGSDILYQISEIEVPFEKLKEEFECIS